MKYSRFSLIALICTILIQLATPYPVFADEATPPAPEGAVEVQPVETEQPGVEVLPVETEQPVLEVAPVETEQSNEAISTEDAPSENLLDALPENTDLVILDMNNEPVPLATEAAVTAIAKSDPAWCPEGASFAAGTCVNYATFSDLITGLHSIGGLTNGTVYVQEGDYLGPESSITLDGTYLPNVGNLTLIGGWDLTLPAPVLTGETTFNVPLSVINWSYSVSIQDINIENANGTGLTVQADGPVTLADVDATANWDNSLSADGINVSSNSDVSLNNVTSSSNTDDGIYIKTNANVTLNNVDSSSNTGGGIYVVTDGDVTLNDVVTLFNYDDGINIKTDANVKLNDVNSSYSGGYGINISPNASVTLNNIKSEHNFFGIHLGGGDSETVSILGGENTILGGENTNTGNNKNNAPLCENKSLITLQLPSGDSLMVYCPIGGTLSVNNIGRKGLPAPLPDGMNFISGIDVTLSQGGVPIQIITDSGHLKPSFVVPADRAGKNLVILFWDASTSNWVELPAFGSEGSASLPNNGTVSEGIQVLNNIGQIEVGVNFPGIFVLAVK
jgi:hypothetical protein